MNGWVDVKTVEVLTGEDRRRVWERITNNDYAFKIQKGVRGGNGGESYLVSVASLPEQAQIAYLDSSVGQCDMAAYQERYGDEGVSELLHKLETVRKALAVRTLNPKDVVPRLKKIADGYGTTMRTLYRWMDAYEKQGLSGIMKAVARKDKGETPSICEAAYHYAYRLYMTEAKLPVSTIYTKLTKRAQSMGAQACEKCPFNEQSELRDEECPVCQDPDKQGLRIPECRQTLSRALKKIPNGEVALGRHGKKVWEDNHQHAVFREKPDKVNEVWFGDHHQFDCFVLDTKGKPIRPWLTGWYDAATGALVGWVLCENPNTETILEAFTNAVAPSKHNPFYGLPKALYIDNGKDYRSKVFETGLGNDTDLGKLNANIGSASVIQMYNIRVIHAQAYKAQSKTIERFFGTMEDIWIRDVPGWCGGSVKERPHDFHKVLKKLNDNFGLWTMDDLFKYLRDTVLPEYHSRPHEGHNGKAPFELYAALPKARIDQPAADMLTIAKLHMEERKISKVGIRFKNEHYWHDAMTGLSGNYVTIRYSKTDQSSISVILNGHFLCEATPVEKFSLIDEDPAKLAAHNSGQRKDYRNTRDTIRRLSSRGMFVDEVDETKNFANITNIEYRKAAKARRDVRTQDKSPRKDNGRDKASNMFMAMYDTQKQKNAR
jgi:putative transposase